MPDRVLATLRERELDALVVTDLVNVRYLTGYTGSNGIAVVGPGVRRFITDFRYETQAAEQVDPSFDRTIAVQSDLLAALKDGWPNGTARVGFEAAHLSVQAFERLREHVPGAIELSGESGVVEDARVAKTPEELARIRAAAQLADTALTQLLETGSPVGRTEHDLAVELEHRMRLLGAEGVAFDLLVAAGAHSALPHCAPRKVPVPRDTVLLFDWGAKLDGYHSDCTRTFATGTLPDELAAIYALVQRAQAAALDAVRPGPPGSEVDAVARSIITDAGYGEQFGHGLGHGVGLDIHEAPRLSKTAEQRLAPGHVVTVEPGIYLPGRGGVRIEDLTVVTDEGCEVLSGLPKDLTVV